MRFERGLEQCHRLLDPVRGEEDLGQPRLGDGGVRPRAGGVEDRDRLDQQALRLAEPAAHRGQIARPGERLSALDILARQPCCPLERALRLERGSQRGGALGGAGEPAPRLAANDVAIGCVGVGLVRVEIVRGDHLGDLVRVDARVRGEKARRRKVARPAVAPGDRLVGDPLHERLQERELPSLGRERIGLDREQLLPHEARHERLDGLLRRPRDRGQSAAREGLAEDRRVLQQAALRLRHTVES